jgi:hypothetical protein
VVSVTPQPPFTLGERNSQYPLDRRLGEPRTGLDTQAREKNPLNLILVQLKEEKGDYCCKPESFDPSSSTIKCPIQETNVASEQCVPRM